MACLAGFVHATGTLAAVRTASANGNWNSTATWGGAAVPTSADTCIINSGVAVTVNTAGATCGSLTIGNATNSNTTLTLASPGTLSITTAGGQSGNLVFNPSNRNSTFTLAVATSVLTVEGTATWSTSSGAAAISVSTGQANFINATGMAWPARGTLTVTGNNAGGSVNFAGLLAQTGGTITNTTTGGTFNFNGGFNHSGGTFTTRAGETLNFGNNLTMSGGATTFNAASTANFIAAATITPTSAITFGNLVINPGAGNTVTLAGNVSAAGDLTVNTGTFDLGTFTAARTAGGGTFTIANGATLLVGASNYPTNYATDTLGLTSTVVYDRNDGTAQTVVAQAAPGYGNLILNGSGTKTMPAAALPIQGTFTMAGTASATAGSALTVGGDCVLGSGTTFNASTFSHSIAGNFTNNGATFAASTSTITLNGTVTQTIGGTSDTTFYNLSVSNGSGVSLASSPTIGGTLTLTSGLFWAGANTLTLNGPPIAGAGAATSLTTNSSSSLVFGGSSAGVVVPSSVSALNSLTISNNPNGVQISGSGGNLTLSGTLTLTSGPFAVGSNTLTLNGPAIAGAGADTNLTTTSSSNIVFGGSATGVSLPGSATALKNLTINNLNGIAMGGTSVTTTLSGTLALGANNLTTNSNTLSLAGDCTANSGNGSLTRTSGNVIGNLQLTFPLTVTNSTCIYNVGDSIGYAPITVTVGASAGGTLTGRVDAGDDPDTATGASGIDPTKSANHYWTLTAGTLSTSVTYSATFQFCANTGSCTPAEVDTAANFNNFVVARKLSGTWSNQTTPIRYAYSTQATGIAGFGKFAVGEINLCFTDSFTGANGASPGTNWSVGNKSGTFGNPIIQGNRLRLTDASIGAATWATLQRPFPAAGNKVTVMFQHFAYGGTSADGIGVVISDGSVAPVAGAFGGSLGYAQKSNPGSDCTTPGGCPGFAGGWLGIGLDEYGNYSANTEGRYGGSPARIQESVAIRGSGSGMSGYRFIQGTGMLSPAVDGDNAIPYHQYRIIVDHTDSVHAWTSVERDTSGSGTSYTTLLGPLDVLDPGYSQNPIPLYLNLSFTGSTGASTNVHEIDNLSVCTVQGLAAPTLHHIELDHGGSACTSSPAPVTVKACANAACTTLYMNSVTVNLNNIAGATWSSDPVTFTGGQTSVTLSKGTAGAVTLGGTATSPTAGNATQCFNGTTQTCTLTFNICTFDVIEVGAAAGTNIYTKLASTAFPLDILSLSGATQTVTAMELVDMSSGTCSSPAGVLSPVTLSPALTGGVPNFTANQRKTFTFTYNNSAPNVRVRVRTGVSTYSCSTDNFAIRPQAIALTSSATQGGSSGAPVFRAGTDSFSLTATVPNNAYTGTPKMNSSLVTSGQANLGTMTNTTFPAATAGVSTATGFKYSEVGNISFGQYAIYDDTFAEVDTGKGDCTPGFSNTADANGKFSCQFGSAAAGAFGRFVPDHFTVVGTIANACTAGTFTYMAQPFTLSTANLVQAMNGGSAVTANYAGPYAPGAVSYGAENADNGTDLSARLSFPGGSWSAGIYTLTDTSSASFSRPVIPDGSFESLDIGLTVTDSDVTTVPIVMGANMNPGVAGGSTFTYKKFSGSPLRMRFGRLRLIAGQGSEWAPFLMQTETQYYDGTYWRTNTDDSCTTYVAGNANASGTTGTSISTANVIKNGYGSLLLSKPTSSGTAAICLDMASTADGCTGSSAANLSYLRGNWGGATYDKDPSATVLFGGANSNSRGNWGFIYRRENF